MRHQYIDRQTASVRTERLYGDRLLQWAYRAPWEDGAWLCRALSSARTCRLLGFFNYDLPFVAQWTGVQRFLRSLGVDLSECLDDPRSLNTPRKVFERRIRYWDVRPMDADLAAVVSPCDARVLVGSFRDTNAVSVKGKLFALDELLGADKTAWLNAFRGGPFAIFRLTPDKYHYNHVPAAGRVADVYELAGRYHSCNPSAVVVASPYAKNARVVTVIDTDVPGGSFIGLVAMIEVVALMIGRIEQRYSAEAYDDPGPVKLGMFLRTGQPKSLYRPGSSTTVLLFQPGRIRLCDDLRQNATRTGVQSRFSAGFGRTLVETDVTVRSTIGYRRLIGEPDKDVLVW